MTRNITSDEVPALAARAAIPGTGGGGAVTTSQSGVPAAV